MTSLKHAFTLAVAAVLTVPALALAEEPIPVTLGNLKNFEVSNFTGLFPSEQYPVAPDIVEYVRSQMADHSDLPYASPGQAILQMGCAGFQCKRVVARVTLGYDGPLLWTKEVPYHHGLPSYHRDHKKIAQEIVSGLEKAYRESAPAYPKRIDVP